MVLCFNGFGFLREYDYCNDLAQHALIFVVVSC